MDLSAGVDYTAGSFGGYFSAWTDFVDYTDVPFSSFILEVGTKKIASLTAYDIVEGLDAGLFVEEVKAGEYGGGGMIAYEKVGFKAELISKYNVSSSRFGGELNVSYHITPALSVFGLAGYGSTKDALGYYQFNDNPVAPLGLEFSNTKLDVELAGQVVKTSTNFEFGAYLEAEAYIVDGAVITVTYNPRPKNIDIVKSLNEDYLGVLEVAYTVKY